MKAFLKNNPQSPRKTRLVADLIRGKSVDRARRLLAFGQGKSAPVIGKLLESAVANARHSGGSVDNLFVKEILVDAGIVMKRMEPKARGQGAIIRHRTSRISLVLGEMTKKGSKKVDISAMGDDIQAPVAAKKVVAKKTVAKKTAKKVAKN